MLCIDEDVWLCFAWKLSGAFIFGKATAMHKLPGLDATTLARTPGPPHAHTMCFAPAHFLAHAVCIWQGRGWGGRLGQAGRRWSFMPRAGACWSYGICVLALRPSALELVAWALTAYSSHKPGKRIWFGGHPFCRHSLHAEGAWNTLGGRMESLIELFGHLEPRCPLQAATSSGSFLLATCASSILLLQVLTTATRSIPRGPSCMCALRSPQHVLTVRQTAIRANQKSRQTHFGGRKNWVTSG
eukprot:g11408.t1